MPPKKAPKEASTKVKEDKTFGLKNKNKSAKVQQQVKIIQQGREPGQGLAYLDDGTMIVVEGGGEMLEREVEVTVVRVLQTVAGRMVFAQPRG